ncbi:cupin domain-containing protein [Salmonella enterica]|nr:cupin domain-containing protein [Salmonella enterica]
MQKTNEKNHEYRFGDNGPKYLIRGPGCDMGVVILQPGQSFPNHRHNTACEVFYTLSGEVCLYLEGTPHILQTGDVLQCEPGEAHYLINNGDKPWKGVFIKSPHLENDSHPRRSTGLVTPAPSPDFAG